MKVEKGVVAARILRSDKGNTDYVDDLLAVEEPLEIAVTDGEKTIPVGVTFRTPGDDEALVAGFLFSEGLTRQTADLRSVELKDATEATMPARRALARVAPENRLDRLGIERAFPISAACGACGKSSLEALRIERSERFPLRKSQRVEATLLKQLPDAMRQAQDRFSETGGIHAAARFTNNGQLLDVAEDVGRHNALDKLIGRAFLRSDLDWEDQILVLSGRVGYDLMQKAIGVGCPVIASVGAASSFAVELANLFDLTLVGFVRPERFNVYSAPDRIDFNV